MSVFMSKYSLYAYEEEIRKGFLTVEGGHRIGVCGQVSCEGEHIRRIPSHILSEYPCCPGTERVCQRDFFSFLLDRGLFQNTLILSAPGIGKTTLLRDVIRMLSDGSDLCAGRKVGLVDERSEIAGVFKGSTPERCGHAYRCVGWLSEGGGDDAFGKIYGTGCTGGGRNRGRAGYVCTAVCSALRLSGRGDDSQQGSG